MSDRQPGQGRYAHLSSEEPLLLPPPWAMRDVTHDERYSGGALAFATDEAIKKLLQ